MPRRACIGLGSNLGDRRTILDSAIRAIAQTPGVTFDSVSTYRETAPVGGPAGQGPFLNAAVVLHTTLEPSVLHARLQEIESEAGRVRLVRWGERTLDLDLLLHGDLVIESADLCLPHPRFALRRFVLSPLAEIAPDALDPMTRQSVADLLANLDRRPSHIVLLGGNRAAPVAGNLTQVLRGTGWRIRTLDPNAFANIARWPESDRPTFFVLLHPIRPGWSRQELVGRLPAPMLWLDGLTDNAAITTEIIATCEASRTG